MPADGKFFGEKKYSREGSYAELAGRLHKFKHNDQRRPH